MSIEENKTIALRMYEEIHNKGDLAAVDGLVTVDFIDHNSPEPGLPAGPEGAKQTFSMFLRAFPDFNATVEDMIAEGDKVVARLTIRGTHKGELMGIAPTGKQVTIGVIDIVRIADTKVAERWGQEDMLGMMQQLGVVPMSGLTGG